MSARDAARLRGSSHQRVHQLGRGTVVRNNAYAVVAPAGKPWIGYRKWRSAQESAGRACVMTRPFIGTERRLALTC